MTGWYDISDISSIDRTEDEAGVLDSAKYAPELLPWLGRVE